MSIGELLFPFINDWALGSRVEPLRAQVAREAKGRVLEVGAGTGLNFHHYREGTSVTAIEPAPGMRRRAEARARAGQTRASIEVVDGRAGALPAEDASVDTVLLTFVLCSVRDMAAALAEVRRVLRPGGELRILEHVKSSVESQARIQRFLNPVWGKVFGGCSLLVDPRAEIERAGFDAGEIHPVTLPMPAPVREGMIGVAIRR